MENKKGFASVTVTGENTALHMGSGSLPVFATPAMVALMEQAACSAVAELLQEGMTTVGTAMSVTHTSATLVGMKVSAEAELISAEGRKLVLSVSASDERGLIGCGTHERFIVNSERFLSKTNEK